MFLTRALHFVLIQSVCIYKCQARCESYSWTQWTLCVDNLQEYRVREVQDVDACTGGLPPCNVSSAEYRVYQCSIPQTDVDVTIQTIRSEILSIEPNVTAVAVHVSRGSATDRLSMSKYYQAAYGSNLLQDLSEAFPIIATDCWASLIGGTTDHVTKSLKRSILLEESDRASTLLITNGNEEIQRIQQQYKLDTGESLDQALVQRFSGDEENVLRSLASAQRNENGVVKAENVESDTYNLRQAVFSSDVSELLRLLGAQDKTHLNDVFNQYKITYGRWIQYHIKRKIVGNVQASFLNIADYITDEAKFCAVKLFFALGLATDTTLDEEAVETTLVDCAKVNLCQTVLKYREIYNRNLADDIEAHYHGTCAQLLVPLANMEEEM